MVSIRWHMEGERIVWAAILYQMQYGMSWLVEPKEND